MFRWNTQRLAVMKRIFASRRFVSVQTCGRSPLLRQLSVVRYPCRQYSMIHLNLIDKCRSCGIALQSIDPGKPGYIPEVEHKPFKKPEDEVFDKYLAQMPEEDRQLMINDIEPQPENENNKTGKNTVEVPPSEEPECQRCRQIKYHNKAEVEEVIPNAAIYDMLPEDAKIISVVNTVDFPIGVHRKYNKNTVVVLTKMDRFFREEVQAKKFPFFKQYINSFGVPSEQIFRVSNPKKWGLQQLRKFLHANPGTYYVLGDVNSGKSSLISMLLFLEKSDPRIRHFTWKQHNGPGISNLPGFTRDAMRFQMGPCTLVDLPGLDQLKVPDFSKFKNVFKNRKVFKHGLPNSKYDSFINCLLTVGGLMYIEPPKGVVMQYKNLFNFNAFKIRDKERIAYFAETFDTNEAIHPRFLVNPTADLDTYVIPPFVGKIDLVVKNVGYVELTPTGAKSTNEPILVHIPRNLNIVVKIRKPIITYVTKIIKGYDKNGQLLRKSSGMPQKTRLEYRNQKISSSLFPLKPGKDAFQTVEACTGLPYNADTVITKDNFEQYWVE